METLKIFGQVAGIGGIALGVFLFLFRDLIRRLIFPSLTQKNAFRIIMTFMLLVWSIAVLGIGAWIWAGGNKPTPTTPTAMSLRDIRVLVPRFVENKFSITQRAIALRIEVIVEKEGDETATECVGEFVSLPPHPQTFEHVAVNGNGKLQEISFEAGRVQRRIILDYVVPLYAYKDEADFRVTCGRAISRTQRISLPAIAGHVVIRH